MVFGPVINQPLEQETVSEILLQINLSQKPTPLRQADLHNAGDRDKLDIDIWDIDVIESPVD